jgi:hypothetical protein
MNKKYNNEQEVQQCSPSTRGNNEQEVQQPTRNQRGARQQGQDCNARVFFILFKLHYQSLA